MKEICCKCGKEAYLNINKQCLECDESISNKRKILKKPKKTYRKLEVLLTIILMIVNIKWSYDLMDKCRLDIMTIYVVIATGVTLFRVFAFVKNGKLRDDEDDELTLFLGAYPCWLEPAINFLIKLAVFMIFDLTKRIKLGGNWLAEVIGSCGFVHNGMDYCYNCRLCFN